jgi:hypothetical protein
MSLATMTRFVVPRDVIARTEAQLRNAGRDGYELFVLWSGSIEGTTFTVQTPHVPKQTSYKRGDGLCVRVEGAALHRLNTWLYENDEVLGAQVHSHSRTAFHSITDDTYPIVTATGGLSLVAANFCKRGLIDRKSALFRLIGGEWVQQPLDLITVV